MSYMKSIDDLESCQKYISTQYLFSYIKENVSLT